MGKLKMGLAISHNAFCGAYSAFNRFRKVIAAATGGSFPPHESSADWCGSSIDEGDWLRWYFGPGFDRSTHPGLFEFFAHSDCDGEISPHFCRLLASEMESLLPSIDSQGPGEGHILSNGGYGGVARKFIAGCRAAAEEGEPLKFG